MLSVRRFAQRSCVSTSRCQSLFRVTAARAIGGGGDNELSTETRTSFSTLQRGATVAGAAGVTYLFYDLTYRFLSLTPYISLKYGFVGGILSTGLIATTLYGLDTYIHTRPDNAFRQASHIATTSAKLKEVLGGARLEGNAVKAYRSNQGYGNLLRFKTPAVELMFTLKGSKGTATVFVHSTHSLLFHKAKIISCIADVNLQSGARSRLLLEGKEDNDRFNVLLRDCHFK